MTSSRTEIRLVTCDAYRCKATTTGVLERDAIGQGARRVVPVGPGWSMGDYGDHYCPTHTAMRSKR